MRALLIGGALLGLGACSPQACDPSQAGFFGGIGCEASGSYGVRNQAQRSALAEQNSAALQNRAQAIDEGARADRAVLNRNEARRRLAGADRQNATLRARLSAARARGADTAQAQSEYDALQAQRASLQAGASAAQMQAYEARQRRLLDSIAGI